MADLITDAPLPEGWEQTKWGAVQCMCGPIIADVSLAHRGRPRGPWVAGAILPARNDSHGINVTMRVQECPTREEAMKAAERLATAMAIWIVGRAREVAGFGDAPAGARL